MNKRIGANGCFFVLLLFLAACQPVTAITPSPSLADFEVVSGTGVVVVISDVAALRRLPDIDSTNVALVERDTRLNVVGTLADESWYQVEPLGEGVTVTWLQTLEGVTTLWVAAAFVEVLMEAATPEPTITGTLSPPATPTSTNTVVPRVTQAPATPTATASAAITATASPAPPVRPTSTATATVAARVPPTFTSTPAP